VQVAAAKARVGVDDGRRPSVEILFHALLPEPLVVHLHPQTLNALTCNERAHELASEILGEDVVVVDYTDPGVPLARAVEQARLAYTEASGKKPGGLTLLRNHGIIAAGQTADEVIALVEEATAKVRAAIEAKPKLSRRAPNRFRDDNRDQDEAKRVADMVLTVAPVLRGLLGDEHGLAIVSSDSSDLVRQESYVGSPIISVGPLIPDEIVYAGSFPCVVEPKYAPLADQVKKAVADYRETWRRDPVIVLLPGKVVFGVGRDLASADNALGTFTDTLRVARDADRLGRVQVLDQAQREFIETWEAESYRQKVAASARRGQMDSKVVVVTGAAQGFGLGIAQGLAAEGAHVVLADLNAGLAQAEADALVAAHGPGSAMAVQVDVSDEASQQAALDQVVARYGGLDVFISNAGVARAASVTEQRVEDFDLVTNINYKGYFLGVRAVVPIMSAQHGVRPDRLFDIVEINSKSGLEGSKRNFAYAGSKFGGIGLTQSFALELIESGIKVNAICPGNFLDGPLWSYPDKGLFVQYLKAGKVPGATSIDDVRAYYESKVPMARGCLPSDVVRAVIYLVDQQYETGQALPVTGGQVMMS
jgi:NAD(P)-dependent dehydrogenase (short-subunit alcohol dehydrogenase family)/rhamnose utilization protein RhaD (predicted bifunctional aldolase and dehydrogenase)